MEETFEGAYPRWGRPCLILEGGRFTQNCGGKARVELFVLEGGVDEFACVVLVPQGADEKLCLFVSLCGDERNGGEAVVFWWTLKDCCRKVPVETYLGLVCLIYYCLDGFELACREGGCSQ